MLTAALSLTHNSATRMPRIITSECDTHTVNVHDYDTTELVRSVTLPERVLGLALSPCLSYLAVATWGQGCHILSPDDLNGMGAPRARARLCTADPPNAAKRAEAGGETSVPSLQPLTETLL